MNKIYTTSALSPDRQDPFEVKRFSQNQVNQILEEAKSKNKQTALTYEAIITHLLLHFNKIDGPVLLAYDEIKKDSMPQIKIEQTKEGISLQITNFEKEDT